MPQPLIILTCMRSYSSLVSTMLGQHPQMYGMPELNLFLMDRVKMMLTVFNRLRPNTMHGLYRSVAELEFGGQGPEQIAQAQAWVKKRQGWSSKRMFAHLAKAVAPRIMIEKSPSTLLKADFVERAYEFLPNANYLHLVRHPRATTRSIDTIMRETERKTGKAKRDKDPEELWLDNNRHAIELMERLAPGQGMRIRGEDLLQEPEYYLGQICNWLEIRDDEEAIEAMLHPELSPYAHVGPNGARFGNDPNFLGNPYFTQREIPEQSLIGPLEWADGEREFSPETVTIARELGYS